MRPEELVYWLRLVVHLAGRHGWTVRRVCWARSGRSCYVKLRDAAGGAACVRLSDHLSRGYRVDGRRRLAINTSRPRLLVHVAGRLRAEGNKALTRVGRSGPGVPIRWADGQTE